MVQKDIEIILVISNSCYVYVQQILEKYNVSTIIWNDNYKILSRNFIIPTLIWIVAININFDVIQITGKCGINELFILIT